MFRLRHINPRVCRVVKHCCSKRDAPRKTLTIDVDTNLIGLGVSICSSLLVLSAGIVTVLTLRESSFEAQHLHKEYDYLRNKIDLIEEKEMQHEMLIDAIVTEIIELKHIGVV